MPSTLLVITYFNPPALEQIIGKPAAMAAKTDHGNPSVKNG